MPEEALLDAPEVDLEPSDPGVEPGNEPSDPGTDPDPAPEPGGAETDTAPVISDANGQLKLSDKARAELDRIKAENPKLAREMRAALFDRQTLLAKVPGGVKEALATLEAYEAEGGSEAVQKIKEELGQWQDLDKDFMEGKREFVDNIATNNPDGFIKAAPHVMAKFAEVAPANFNYEVGKVFRQDMLAHDVVLNMKLLQREIKMLPEANRGPVQELWNALAGYVDRVKGISEKAPEAKTTTADVSRGTSDIDQREQALTIQEFGVERERALDTVTQAEFKRQMGTRKATETQISAIQELYNSRLDKMLRSDKNHTSKVDRFLAAKDKAGYAKHMAAAYRLKAPLAMEQAFKAVMPGKPGPAIKTPPARTAANGTRTAATATTGFTRSATKPDHNAVDWQATARIPGKKGGDGKFVMRDGSKVLYQR
jgi:hypothetical protein